MNYAIIESGTVVNIIVGPLPLGMEGVSLGERPVAIGDAYSNGVFLRDGQPVLTSEERISALEAQIASLLEQLSA